MRLLVAFPALTPLLTTYLDLHLRPQAALGLSLLLIYTAGSALLAALIFERKDL
jgi:ABC-2 type transport system permease protein